MDGYKHPVSLAGDATQPIWRKSLERFHWRLSPDMGVAPERFHLHIREGSTPPNPNAFGNPSPIWKPRL
jgi:hypothetical protein